MARHYLPMSPLPQQWSWSFLYPEDLYNENAIDVTCEKGDYTVTENTMDDDQGILSRDGKHCIGSFPLRGIQPFQKVRRFTDRGLGACITISLLTLQVLRKPDGLDKEWHSTAVWIAEGIPEELEACFFCICFVLAAYHSDSNDFASEILFRNRKRTATTSTLNLCFDDIPVLQLEFDPSLLINVQIRTYYATRGAPE